MIFQENGTKKQVDVDIPISDKVHLKLNLIKRNKDKHFIPIKGKLTTNITVTNIYLPYTGRLNFVRTIRYKITDKFQHSDSVWFH